MFNQHIRHDNTNSVKMLRPFYLVCTVFFVVLIIGLNSCKKFVEVAAPKDQIVTSVVFSDDATATSAISGLYTQIMDFNNCMANGGVTICAGLSADEIYNRNSNADDDAFRSNSVSPSGENLYNWLWSPTYSNIYHVNAILEGVSASNNLTPEVKKQLTGEAKFIRGLCYFYLTNLFGSIPLITTTDYRSNAIAPNTPREGIYQQVVSDLKDAKNSLVSSYYSSDRTRPNKYAAAALLARVYLYQKDWLNAEQEASAVINSGLYTLEPDLNNVFLNNSPEILFQLIPARSFNSTAEGLAFVPGAAPASRPTYLLTNEMLAAFEAGDKRRMFWVKTKTVNSIDYNFSYKYKIRTSPTPANEYNIVIRYAEQYLIRAEARAQQDNIAGAQNDLNIIRMRAELPETPAAERSELLSAVLHERKVELFAEWGHRMFDLVRTGKANEILGVLKSPNWQATDTIYPIPQSQLKLNPFLKQNAGY